MVRKHTAPKRSKSAGNSKRERLLQSLQDTKDFVDLLESHGKWTNSENCVGVSGRAENGQPLMIMFAIRHTTKGDPISGLVGFTPEMAAGFCAGAPTFVRALLMDNARLQGLKLKDNVPKAEPRVVPPPEASTP